MEGRYSPGVFMALMDCIDPAKEDEFNRWYGLTLIPALEELGCVRNSRRYENVYAKEGTFRGRPKYLAIHEVYHDRLDEALKMIRHREAKLKADGKWFDSMLTKASVLYGRVGPEFHSGHGGGHIEILYCGMVGYTDPNRKAEFDAWYNDRHSPDALNAGLCDTGYRFDVVDPYDPAPHQSSRCLSLYETSVDLATLERRLEGFRKQMFAVDPLWVSLLSITYSGLFRPMP
ncbi:MAG: hypothetical protein EXR49_06505 [Dehalococcoidia bacterium]|nr:hypothetical protein [Dehalococcoidia bacterium]